ncbi:MAG: PAS domain S-box protein [Deltaproteobacteria bacterium]|nr:PAS domain S-box protein [Deltaproteobacteria bacterium]
MVVSRDAQDAVGQFDGVSTRDHDRLAVLTAIFEQASYAVAVLSSEGIAEEVNASFLRVYGLRREEVLGKSWLEFVSSTSTLRDVIDEIRWRLFEERAAWQGEVSGVNARDELIWREVFMSPVMDDDGTVAHLVYMSRDITVRKEAEEALGDSERKYRLLAEHAADMIWTMDSQLRVTFVSPAVFRIRGITPEEAMGQTLPEFIAPGSLAEVRSIIEKRLQLIRDGGPGAWESLIFEAEQLHKNGTMVWVSIHATLLRGDDGKLAGVVGVTHDISARKESEAARESLQAQFLQAQKMEAIGRLAGGVAHDFNNLLSVIIVNASLAQEGISPDDRRESLSEISQAAKRAADLTRQLLAFSREQIIAPEVLDLSALVERVHPMLVRLIGEDLILEKKLHRSLGRVRVDAGQIEQCLLNLIVNARDAMPEGGDLVVETAEVVLDEAFCVRYPAVTPGEHVMLAVNDTGLGMSPEVQAKIFEPFFTTKEMGRGTGLGLATVLGIVEQHGGCVEVHSEPGRGTSFRMYFPRVEAEASPSRSSVKHAVVGGDETILVVEDDEFVRKMAVRILRRMGYRVLRADSGEEALALASQHDGAIDLLFTDVLMPRMDGHELAMRFAELRPDTKVLYASGHSEDVIAHHGVLREGLAFIAKPYAIDALARRIREVLDTPSGDAAGSGDETS